jgi:hypothetical protein
MGHHDQRLVSCALHFTQHFQHLYPCFRIKAEVGKSIAGVFDNEAEAHPHFEGERGCCVREDTPNRSGARKESMHLSSRHLQV